MSPSTTLSVKRPSNVIEFSDAGERDARLMRLLCPVMVGFGHGTTAQHIDLHYTRARMLREAFA